MERLSICCSVSDGISFFLCVMNKRCWSKACEYINLPEVTLLFLWLDFFTYYKFAQLVGRTLCHVDIFSCIFFIQHSDIKNLRYFIQMRPD